jgi:PPM family protein phosphatase
MQLELAILSQPGGRENNEDACGHWSHDNRLCCVVADGAGGHGGGQRASQLAVQALLQSFAQRHAASSRTSDESCLQAFLRQASRQIIECRSENTAQRHMHTTVVTLWIDLDRQEALWAHCGDSRLYAFRAGQMLTRTRDHSLVQSLVDGGLLKESELRTHPQRSELLSALGVDESDLQISVHPQPWVLTKQDAFLLCTDGVWEWIDDDTTAQTLQSASGPHEWLQLLQTQLLSATAQNPHHDNYSALAVWVRES